MLFSVSGTIGDRSIPTLVVEAESPEAAVKATSAIVRKTLTAVEHALLPSEEVCGYTHVETLTDLYETLNLKASPCS